MMFVFLPFALLVIISAPGAECMPEGCLCGRKIFQLAGCTPELFLDYNEYETCVANLMDITDRRFEVLKIGESRNSKDIYVIKVSNDVRDYEEHHKKHIFVDAALHGNESVAVPAVMAFVRELIGDDFLLEKTVFHVATMVNPDGFQLATTNPDAVKNEQDASATDCKGVNLNRNFDFHHEEVEKNSCSDEFGGLTPHSEPETKAVYDYVQNCLKNHEHGFDGHISLHSVERFIAPAFGESVEGVSDENKRWGLAYGLANAIERETQQEFRVVSRREAEETKPKGTFVDWLSSKGCDFSYVVSLGQSRSANDISEAAQVELAINVTTTALTNFGLQLINDGEIVEKAKESVENVIRIAQAA